MSKTAVAALTKQNGAASTNEKRNWSRLGIVFWIAVSWVCIITFSAAFADFLPFQDLPFGLKDFVDILSPFGSGC